MHRRFEGFEVLDARLSAAGSTYGAEEVKEEFEGAHLAGACPEEVFPVLFHDEPVFADDALAARLYANLFGLWDRVTGASKPVRMVDVPARGQPLPAAWVEASWKTSDGLDDRALAAAWDRFSNRQDAVMAFLGSQGISDAEFDTLALLSFEIWQAYERAYVTPALDGADFHALEAAAPPELALCCFAKESLELAVIEGAELDLERCGALIDRVIGAMSLAFSR